MGRTITGKMMASSAVRKQRESQASPEVYRKETVRELQQFLKRSDTSVEGMSHGKTRSVKPCLTQPRW